MDDEVGFDKRESLGMSHSLCRSEKKFMISIFFKFFSVPWTVGIRCRRDEV